jgi:hypothetical protein
MSPFSGLLVDAFLIDGRCPSQLDAALSGLCNRDSFGTALVWYKISFKRNPSITAAREFLECN